MLWIDTESGTWGGDHRTLRLVELTQDAENSDDPFEGLSDSEISDVGKEHGSHVAPAQPHGHDIVRLTPSSIITLMERLSLADLEGLSVRIQTGSDAHGPWIKWDIGNGGWTAPIRGESF